MFFSLYKSTEIVLWKQEVSGSFVEAEYVEELQPCN